MKQKIFKCGLIGGVILFIWSAASWMLFPMYTNQFHTFSNEESVQSTISANAPVSGLYTVPAMGNCSKNGPYLFAAIKTEGMNCSMTGAMASALAVRIIAAIIVAALLFQTKLKFKKSVLFITAIGFLLGMVGVMPLVIWFGFPGMYAFVSIFESVVGWFLAGLGMSKLARR
jgi:hypothetical protein